MKKSLATLMLFTIWLSADAADSVRLKTGREIFASYVNILGVSSTDPDVLQLYQQDISRLPQQGLPAELSSNVVLATTELGGLFCQKAITREQSIPGSQRHLFSDVDFTVGPSQFTAYTTGKMLETLALKFWQRDITSGEVTALTAVIQNTALGASNTPDQTTNVAQVLCTLYASSVSLLVK